MAFLRAAARWLLGRRFDHQVVDVRPKAEVVDLRDLLENRAARRRGERDLGLGTPHDWPPGAA